MKPDRKKRNIGLLRLVPDNHDLDGEQGKFCVLGQWFHLEEGSFRGVFVLIFVMCHCFLYDKTHLIITHVTVSVMTKLLNCVVQARICLWVRS